ncbi:MAG: NAD(P)H-binding protein [Burkholderiales bacterium]
MLGGAGFIGRHVVAALVARGHEAIVGTRDPARAGRHLPPEALGCERRRARLEQLTAPGSWDALLAGVDVVVNCVGILRERGRETYARVHGEAPAALARDCARLGVRRLIHVSALGLHGGARSRFLLSKLHGEAAVKASGLDWSIVRPSLLDGEGGFGARWMRRVARWPVHCVPVEARGRIAALDVGDLGVAIAALCGMRGRTDLAEVELGGPHARTMAGQLAAMRSALGLAPALRVPVPALLARLVSHVCDLLHFSPFSYGHLELLRRDNVPGINRLPYLLQRAPKAIGVEAGGYGAGVPALVAGY